MEAKAAERYRQLRRSGRPTRELRTVNGPRLQAKASAGWKGARFRAVIPGAGVLLFLAGAVLLVTAPGARVVVSGLYFVGLGVGIVIGHPVSVVLARRRWASRVTTAPGESSARTTDTRDEEQ
ncbi:hypothetical protein [Streptomyces canus]|uniref:hypothetical protein n=1 Tax=Streptomyces canus TaxID=58343 RepID=UPI0036EAEAD0